MNVRNCRFCREEFKTELPKKKKQFCGEECIKKSRLNRVLINCEYCGEEFEMVPSRSDVRFCSKKCVGQAKSEKHTEILECEHCGEEFEVNKSSTNKFCSRRCAYDGITERAKTNRECEHCGEEFACKKGDTQRFCSIICVRKWRSDKGSILKECRFCGEEFKTAISNDHQFCNYQCFRAYEIESRQSKLSDCHYCGEEFLARPIKHNKDGYSKFCSEKCWRNDLEENHRENLECLNCGEEVQVIKYYAEIDWGIYCSRQCYLEHKRKGIDRNCAECGEEFYVSLAELQDEFNHQYCSKKCYAEGRELYPKTIHLRRKIQALRAQAKDYFVRNTDIDRSEIPESLIELKMVKDKYNRKIKEKKDG